MGNLWGDRIKNLNIFSHRSNTVQSLEAGELLVEYLAQIGVEYVFGIPGGAIEPLFNALARGGDNGGPQAIVSRHETGAAFMADGYARNSGKLGVCCATTGPGTTNLVTGVASAYENNIPLLVITAQTTIRNFGRGAFQESTDTGINVTGMLQYCTAYNTVVTHIDQFERKLINAILIGLNDRRPVHISVPIDILCAEIPRKKLYDIFSHWQNRGGVYHDKIAVLQAGLQKAGKAVFVLGPGCAQAISLIQRCAMLLNAEIVTTPDARGLMSAYHPLFRGVIGFAGHKQARALLQSSEVDVIVAVGTNLGEWSTNAWDRETLINQRLIQIDSSSHVLARTPVASLHIQGDVVSVFKKLLRNLGMENGVIKSFLKASKNIPSFSVENVASQKPGWASKPVKPQWLMQKLPEKFPPFTRYLADTGNGMAWAIHYLHPFDRRMGERRLEDHQDSVPRRQVFSGLFQTTIEFAAMGWAIGASIGTSLARPDKPVVCITGDGSFLMNGQEITVAVQQKLPIIFVVLNDAALGMVKHGQRLTGAEEIGYKLPNVDYAMMAQAMGLRGINIGSPKEFMDLDIRKEWLAEGPILLDVIIDAEEVPPLASRTDAIRSASEQVKGQPQVSMQ